MEWDFTEPPFGGEGPQITQACLRVRNGWEAIAAPVFKETGEFEARRARRGWEMKNTGKRIFYSVAFFALMSLPVLVSAAAPASTR